MEMKTFISVPSVLIILSIFTTKQCEAQLSTAFYDATCPNAATIIGSSIREAISRDPRMAASLIRLYFHDCFVQGCDASVLLDATPEMKSEKTSFPNMSLRGYQVIEAAKAAVESACLGVVSCADVITLAARDASVFSGGPSWSPTLGRRDSTAANHDGANVELPRPDAPLDILISSFASKGLSARDMVALSGSHTLGQAECSLFRKRIYSNGTDIDADFASTRRQQCPLVGGDRNLAPLDVVTPNSFDNNYFNDLIQRKGLLETDQVLFSGGSTDSIVTEYARNPQTFASDFATAMIKVGQIQPLLGQIGIIRRVCCAIN